MEQAIRDRQMIDEFVNEVNAVQKEMVDKFIAENELLDDWRNKGTPFIANISSPSFYHAVTPAMIKAREWEAEQNNYRVSKTREIIAKLELGANKNELEAMLAEVLRENQ